MDHMHVWTFSLSSQPAVVHLTPILAINKFGNESASAFLHEGHEQVTSFNQSQTHTYTQMCMLYRPIFGSQIVNMPHTFHHVS